MRTALTQNWLVCRICLQAKGRMESIFSENAEKDLTKMILECGGVPIKQFDHYPDKICVQCDRNLKVAHKFRMTCQRSHRHLSKFLAPVVIEEEIEAEIIKNDKTEENEQSDQNDESEYNEDNDQNDHVDVGDELEDAFNGDDEVTILANLNEEDFKDTKVIESGNVVDVSEAIQGELFLREETVDSDEVSLKLEPNEDETINIKKEDMSELDEAEIVDFYEPIEDVEIFEEFEDEPNERTTSALSEEIEYLDEIMNEEIADSDGDFLPSTKNSDENTNSSTTETTTTTTTTTIVQQVPKSRGRPKGSKNTKPTSTSVSNTLAAKGKQPDRRGRKPKNPDFTVYICDICGNTYPTQGRLTDHIRKHNNIKRHECEICGHAFQQAQQLSRHMNTHTGKRPYKCNYCPAAFADLSTRNKHHRIHTNERPYGCDVCGKAFAYTNTLKFHKMIHTGEKPFVCNICGKGFHQSYKLRNHKRTHEKRAIKAKKLELEALAAYQEVNEATSQILEI